MKKCIPIFICILFVVFGLLPLKRLYFCNATSARTVTLKHNNNMITFYEDDWVEEDNKYLNNFTPRELLLKVYTFGIGVENSLKFVYPNMGKDIEKVCGNINKEVVNSEVLVRDGSPKITEEECGKTLDLKALYSELFYELISNKIDIMIELKVLDVEPKVKREDNLDLTNEKAFFRTYINGENQEGRIRNIGESLSRFNGFVLNPKESVSFNEIIGETTKENGYSLAKVILNGEYVEDYGGGVCQSATTLYNASLLAGLNIKKVRPHSLKVGYVLGSFDAMVSGFSDLVIENPYNTPVFFHTYTTPNECGVKIFGAENEFQIERRNEKIEFNEEEFPDVAYKSEGYLDYYKNGEFIKSEKIRTDSYLKPVVKNSL